jgi:hypothetical protein
MRTRTLGLLLVAAALAVTPVSATPQGQTSIHSAVTRYARGDFDAAATTVETTRLTVTHFTEALDAWIVAGDPAGESRRRRVAAVFALDTSWRATRTAENFLLRHSDPWRRHPPVHADRETLRETTSLPLVGEWAVAQLPATGTLDATERMIWRTAIGLAQDGHAWHRLENGLLPMASKRLPDDARVKLAVVLASTNVDLGRLRPIAGFPRPDVLQDERLGSSVTGKFPKAIAAFEALRADPRLAGEASLRIGYLELRRRRWPAAIVRFDAARSAATEPTLVAASNYFAGWVFEQEGRTADAIAAYRRAHAITPLMRNLATRLSALLYLTNERAEAFAILDPALNVRPAPLDFLYAIERADARFVPEWLTGIRQALR